MKKKELILTDFDLLTTQGSTQIAKAIIPFLSPSEQRNLAILVRIVELMQTIRYFDEQTAIWCGIEHNFEFTPSQMSQLKKYCTPESQQTIDTLLNFMNISSVMNMMNTGSESLDKSHDSGTNFSNMGLDPNMLNNLQSMFANFNQGSNIAQTLFSKEQSDLYQNYMEQLNQKFQ